MVGEYQHDLVAVDDVLGAQLVGDLVGVCVEFVEVEFVFVVVCVDDSQFWGVVVVGEVVEPFQRLVELFGCGLFEGGVGVFVVVVTFE